MRKSKSDHLHELALIAFKIDDKSALVDKKTERLRRMATLSREDKKDSEEFKMLDREFKHPTVIDFGDDFSALRKVVKRLRKYKIT